MWKPRSKASSVTVLRTLIVIRRHWVRNRATDVLAEIHTPGRRSRNLVLWLDAMPTLRDIKRDLRARGARTEQQSGRSFLSVFHATAAARRGAEQAIVAAPVAERVYQVGHFAADAAQPLR